MLKINDYIDDLLKIKLFESFERAEINELFKVPKYNIKAYQKGQIVHMQSEACSTMGIVLKGKLSVQRIDENGNVLKVAFLGTGEVLGINLLFSGRSFYPMTIVSDTKSIIINISKDFVIELTQNNVAFMSEIMRIISDKTQIMTDKIHAVTLKTIRQKIKDFIAQEVRLQQSNVIVMPLSKKDLAETMGIQRSSLSRELGKMREEGLITYNSKTLTVKDKLMLK